ncbi:MAG: S8 family serine peptidase [Planctomycetota bacterium]|jgi:subtilisin family serine protease
MITRNGTNLNKGSSCSKNATDLSVVFEQLEQRLLLDGTTGNDLISELLSSGDAVAMEWNGEQVYATPDQWILSVDGLGGSGPAQLTATQEFIDATLSTLSGQPAPLGEGASDPLQITVTRQLGDDGLLLLETSASAEYEQVLDVVDDMPGFQYIEPDFLLWADSIIPNDPRFDDLYGLHNTGQTGGTPDADIDAPEAWDIHTGNGNIVVGVIDTGVDYTHPDLVDNMWHNPGEIDGDGIDNDGNGFIDDYYGWDFAYNDSNPMDGHSHGTHCSGTIAGAGNNSLGVVGVSWNVQIMALKFLNDSGSGSTSDAVDTLNYAIMMRDSGVNIRLTSNSWGGGGYSSALEDAIRRSGDAGMLFIAAAGNDSDNTDSYPHYPSSYNLDNIISVAATDHNDNKASFSNWGLTTVDLGAPGVDTLSSTPGGNYGYKSGTSMATPHVAGVAALAFDLNPSATYQEVRDAIFAGVDLIPSMDGRTVTGGRLNAFTTLQLMGLPIDSSSPADGDIVTSLLTDFAVTFGDPYDPASIQETDLLVNSISADSFTLTDDWTVTFHYATSPITAEGEQSMFIAAGSITRLSDGLAVNDWSSTFRYDVLPMEVVAMTPPDGAAVSLPLNSIVFDFNEDYDPASVGLDDLTLSMGEVTGFTLVDADTIEYAVAGLNAENVFHISFAAGALTDVYGNPMVAYNGALDFDFGSMPYPVPMESVLPDGSLIYDPAVSGMISAGGDTDSFTLDVDAGQTITVVLTPELALQAVVELYDPSGALVSTNSAAGAGDEVVLQPSPVTTAGIYTVTISAVGASTGPYTAQMLLNTAMEAEAHGGAANNTLATAQDIDSSFIALGGGASRGAVMGELSIGGEDWYSFALAAGELATLALTSLAGNSVQVELYDAAGSLLAVGETIGGAGKGIEDFVGPTSGTYYVRTTGEDAYSLVVVRSGTFDLEPPSAVLQDISLAGTVLGGLRAGGQIESVEMGLIQVRSPWGSSSNTYIAQELGFNVTTISLSSLPTADLSVFDIIVLAGNQTASTYSQMESQMGVIDQYVAAGGVWVFNNAAYWVDDVYAYDLLPGAAGVTFVEYGGANVDVLDPTSELITGPGGTITDTTLDGGNHSVHGYTTTPEGNAVLSTGDPSHVIAFDYAYGSGYVITHTIPVEYYGGSGGFGVFHRNLFNFAALMSSDTDEYVVNITAGDTVTITTTTPADGPGEFVNALDPVVELYDPSGNLVASDDNSGPDGRNAELTFVAAASGEYVVRVFSNEGEGEYVLHVTGHTVAAPPFVVTATDPADGLHMGPPAPTEITVDFSDAVLVSSLDVSDLMIDGLAATGFTVVDADTVAFHLPAIGTGVHSFIISGGSILDLQGTPLDAYAGMFDVDVTGPRVVASSMTEGDQVAPGGLSVTVQFDEGMDAAVMDASDFSLVGAINGAFPADSFVYDPATMSLTMEFNGLVEDAYALTLLSGSGHFEDVLGNALDGEAAWPLPSGDGVPGGDFVVNFWVDEPDRPFPVPLVGERPFGSLIYREQLYRVIGAPGDTDIFTLSADVGQTLTVTAEPQGDLEGTVLVQNPLGAIVGMAALTPGQDIVVQTIPVATPGLYTITVYGVGDSTGVYSLTATLNAMAEAEAHGGPSNDTPATAEDIESSFIGPGLISTVTRAFAAEVIGTDLIIHEFDPVDGDSGNSFAGPQAVSLLGYQGLAAGTSSLFYLDSSNYLAPVLWELDMNTGSVIDSDTLDFAPPVYIVKGMAYLDGHLYFSYLPDTIAVWDPATDGLVGTLTVAGDLMGGLTSDPQRGTLFATNSSGGVLEIDPADGSVVNSFMTDLGALDGGLSFANGDLLVMSLDLGGLAYRIDPVDGSVLGELSLEGLTGGVIGLGAGVYTLPPVSDMERGAVTGELAPGGDEDWYKFDLHADEVATLAVSGDSSVQLELYSSNGVLLALGAEGGKGVTQAIDSFVASDFGAYYARVTGEGIYNLVVTRNATLGLSPVDGPQDITGVGTVVSGLRQGNNLVEPLEMGLIQDNSQPWGYNSNVDIAQELGYTVTLVPSASLGNVDLSVYDVILLSGDQPLSVYSNVETYLPVIEDYVSQGGVLVLNYATGWAANYRDAYNYDVLPGADGVSFVGDNGNNNIMVLDPNSEIVVGPHGTITDTNLDGSEAALGYTNNPIGNSILSIENVESVVTFEYTFGGGNVIVHTLPIEYMTPRGRGAFGVFHRNLFHYAGTLAVDINDYVVSVAAGDVLTITTGTPADGEDEFVNDLDPAIELYDPAGNLVASDDNSAPGARNALLTYTATESGEYVVRALSSEGRGDYVLTVSGQTGVEAFTVASTDPADGFHMGPPAPTQMTVTFSDGVLLPSLNASDLTIDGIAATGMTIVDATTAIFDLPALGTGVHQVAIATGAVLDLQGTPLTAYSGTFEVDVTAPRVASSSVVEGGVVEPGNVTLTIGFDEPMNDSVIDASDFSLVGSITGSHTATSFVYDPATWTLTLDYAGLLEDAYTLTLLSGSGRFEDTLGNVLDGEPVWPLPSGDGVAGGDFVVNFSADVTSSPFPVPLTAQSPEGSLVYEGSEARVIGAAGDTDGFTLEVDPDQTITIVLTTEATLQGSVEVRDPSGVLLGSSSAGAAGEDVVLQTIPSAAGGTYTVTVAGVGSTTGTYELQVVLNAAAEAENHDGPANDSLAAAEDIEGSFIALGGGASRGAVTGDLPDGQADEDWYSFALTAGDFTTLVATRLADSAVQVELYDAAGAIQAAGADVGSPLGWAIEDFVVPASGTYYVRMTGDGAYRLVVTQNATLGLSPVDEPQDISPTGVVVGSSGGSGEGVEPDDYAAGADLTNVVDGVTLTVVNSSSPVRAQYSQYASTGTLVFADGTDVAWSSNAEWLRADFDHPVSEVSIDLVANDSDDPGIVRAYDANDNLLVEVFDPAQPVGQARTVTISRPTADIAYIFASGNGGDNLILDNLVIPSLGSDEYSVRAQAGDVLTIRTSTPADGVGEFVNDLDPAIELYDPSGNLVATDDNSDPDGRNVLLTYTAAQSGEYVIQVSSAGGRGEYVLTVAGHTGVADPTPLAVTQTDPADGLHIGPPAPTQMIVSFSDVLLMSTVDPSDLTIDGVAASGVTAIDGRTVAFDLPTIDTGMHTVEIAAGAILSLRSAPIAAYTGQFEIDVTAPRVVSSSMAEGDVVGPGNATVTISFDEPLADAQIDANDFSLVGVDTGARGAASFDYDPATWTLTLEYLSLPDDSYTLTLKSGDGAFEDTLGNDLDGEPVWPLPSGDGVEGGDFFVNFLVDSKNGSIDGQVYDDLDGDGTRNGDDVGLDGRTVELLDEATGALVATTTTVSRDLNGDGVIDPATESGYYEFTGLVQGVYEIRQIVPVGWEQTAPLRSGDERTFAAGTDINGDFIIIEFDPATGDTVNTFPGPQPIVSAPFAGLAVGPNSLFYVDAGDTVTAVLWELDMDTGAVIDSDVLSFSNMYFMRGMAYLDGLLYIHYKSFLIAAWDPATDALVDTLNTTTSATGNLAAAPDLGVLFDTTLAGDILAIDPTTGATLNTIIPGVGPLEGGLAYANGELLVANDALGELIHRIDPLTGAVLGGYTLDIQINVVGLAGDMPNPPVPTTHLVTLEPNGSASGLAFGNRAVGMTADFSGDGSVDNLDIDALYANLGNPAYDLDGDGDADTADVDVLIHDILNTEYGDANMDGLVDATDLAIFKASFGGNGLWAEGNFNGDSLVDITDLAILSANFGFQRPAEAPQGGESAPDQASTTAYSLLSPPLLTDPQPTDPQPTVEATSPVEVTSPVENAGQTLDDTSVTLPAGSVPAEVLQPPLDENVASPSDQPTAMTRNRRGGVSPIVPVALEGPKGERRATLSHLGRDAFAGDSLEGLSISQGEIALALNDNLIDALGEADELDVLQV